MGITAITGPFVSFGETQTSSGAVQEYNSQAGPSAFYQGVMLYDGRPYYGYQPGQGATAPVYGWVGTDSVVAVSQVPTTISTNTIAQTQTSTTTTTKTLTLTASNTTNATVGVSITAPENGQTVTGLIAIDSAMTTVTYGSDGAINAWSPATSLARCVSIFATSDDSGGVFTVNGRDVYGYLMSETVVGASANGRSATTQKAFKYISTITASGTINSTGVIVGVADTFGLPLMISNPGQLSVFVSSGTQSQSLATLATVVVGSTVATQTSTTPDVRGTFASSIASNGDRRFTFVIRPNAAALGSTGLFGGTQYSTA